MLMVKLTNDTLLPRGMEKSEAEPNDPEDEVSDGGAESKGIDGLPRLGSLFILSAEGDAGVRQHYLRSMDQTRKVQHVVELGAIIHPCSPRAHHHAVPEQEIVPLVEEGQTYTREESRSEVHIKGDAMPPRRAPTVAGDLKVLDFATEPVSLSLVDGAGERIAWVLTHARQQCSLTVPMGNGLLYSSLKTVLTLRRRLLGQALAATSAIVHDGEHDKHEQ
mmetsp:Transcript_18485/g.46481  ORF Transcript_18485/g.46481 Transcript_18485/m.46481 type:complete len:220 (+) Transcript_18485:2678-3337(+)